MVREQKELFSQREWERVRCGLKLSAQQGALAHNLLLGKSDKQIAMEMGIAVPTVRSHITRLFHKFDVSDRVELILHLVGYLQACHESMPELQAHPLVLDEPSKSTEV